MATITINVMQNICIEFPIGELLVSCRFSSSYQKCLCLMDNMTSYWTMRLTRISVNITNYREARTPPGHWETKLMALDFIESFYVDADQFLANFKTTFKACSWPTTTDNQVARSETQTV